MIIPIDPITWLKIIGAVFTASGSIVLAWRVKAILEWVKYCLVAHEVSIQQLILVTNGQPQTQPAIRGSIVHLLSVEDKFGFILLVIGFFMLAIGMLCNAVSYFFV